MTKAAVELAERGIRVNAHYPQGAIARFTQPEEVAEAITGACLSIDFALTSGY